MRIEGAKTMRNGGWWHPFDIPLPPVELRRWRERPKPVEAPPPDFGAMMSRWRETASQDDLEAMEEDLGLLRKSLWWIGATFSGERRAMAFPMYDGPNSSLESPCGIRLRTLDGKKFAVTGSKSGVFFPWRALHSTMTRWDFQRVFICEGPTDTAACLQMGFFALGRASCRGGESVVTDILNQLASEAVIVSDNDGPGAEGADALARCIQQPHYRITPPGKDFRAFIRDGGTSEIVESLLENSLRKSSTQK